MSATAHSRYNVHIERQILTLSETTDPQQLWQCDGVYI